MRSIMRKAVAAALTGAVLVAGVAAVAPAAAAQSGKAGAKASAQQDGAMDLVIFRDGKTAEGTILEETDTTIKMRVVVAGISAETVYDKAKILQIQRAAKPAENAAAAKPAAAEPVTSKPAPAKDGATKVYHVKLTGEFGRDISQTPMKAMVADARKHQPEFIVIELDNEFKWFGQEIPEYAHFFDQLFRAEEIDPILTDEIRDDPQWTTKPRVVFWIRRAMGGAAFLPLSCPEIYFHSEGRMGGIGRVEETVQGGDHVVREKLYSARMGHVEGMAIRGGHPPELVRAMCRTEYVLSVGFEGGRPLFHERMPESAEEILLTDDGQGDNEDASPLDGNDVLTLTADVAQRIGFSKGTVDSLEDLMFELGIARNYQLVESRGQKILGAWSTEIEEAERTIRRVWGQMADTPIGGEYEERTRARGVHLRALKQIRGVVDRYQEAINPRNLPQPMGLDQLVTWLNLRIDELEQEQRRDRR